MVASISGTCITEKTLVYGAVGWESGDLVTNIPNSATDSVYDIGASQFTPWWLSFPICKRRRIKCSEICGWKSICQQLMLILTYFLSTISSLSYLNNGKNCCIRSYLYIQSFCNLTLQMSGMLGCDYYAGKMRGLDFSGMVTTSWSGYQCWYVSGYNWAVKLTSH